MSMISNLFLTLRPMEECSFDYAGAETERQSFAFDHAGAETKKQSVAFDYAGAEALLEEPVQKPGCPKIILDQLQIPPTQGGNPLYKILSPVRFTEREPAKPANERVRSRCDSQFMERYSGMATPGLEALRMLEDGLISWCSPDLQPPVSPTKAVIDSKRVHMLQTRLIKLASKHDDFEHRDPFRGSKAGIVRFDLNLESRLAI